MTLPCEYAMMKSEKTGREEIQTKKYSEVAFEVELMSCVIDKAQNLMITECDSHFSAFTGIPVKDIKGRLSLLEFLIHKDRETVIRQLCQKNVPYVYIDFYIKNKDGDYGLVHCICHNIPGTSRCRLALGDVSQSERESKQIKKRADRMNALIDLVEGGVCLFKVTQDMDIIALYMNAACCRFFGTAQDAYLGRVYRLDELIFKDDKSAVYQAIGNSMATKKPIDMELRVITHRDSFIWCKFNSAIHSYDEDGCPVFHAVFTDISKIKAAEQQADAERDTMVSIFKQLPGPLFYTESATPFKLEVVTEDFTRLTGYSRAELFEGFAGDLSCLILAEDFPAAEAAYRRQVEDSKLLLLQYRITTKSGRTLRVIDRRRLVDIGNGKIIAIGMLKDPTATQIADDINLLVS